ncbi:M56 family metallopeptidase [Emticicia sp. BO119]|uniref:M56 family metallopeptidase n=1 Tax=Emticicia sp. BO119 TaxID=2757768 RepID=UPI0015F09279|nr:M56 family metallopeptidase [Emticicia sp. BO119]MBA4848857.1 TonB family protein [Emticicia sp. BO119]
MDFLFYLVQVNLYLILFYSFYRLVLFGETFHHLNRAYLIVSALLSFGIPLWYSEYVQSWFITKEINEVFYTLYDPSMILIRPTKGVSFTWANILEGLYIVGISIFTIRLVITLLQLIVVLKNKDFEKFTAFSFFGYSFVDETLKKRDTILAHEHVHIQQLHSADVMIFEVIAILNWFNPVVYQYKKDIKHIHEFIADDIAAQNESSKADYAMLLFTQEFGLQPDQLTNRFFTHSTLKRRIQMLSKPRSRNIMLMKYGLAVPLFVLMLVLSSATVVTNQVLDLVEVKLSGLKESSVGFETPANASAKKDILLEEANDKVITGKVISADDGKPLPGVNVEVVNKNRGTTTNTDGDFKINVSDTDKLRFSFNGFETTDITVGDKTAMIVSLKLKQPTESSLEQVEIKVGKKTVENDSEVFDSVEENPEYPGGVKQLYTFINNNLRYPIEAAQNNITGKVFVKFVVRKDGSISDLKILKGIGYGCDEEAVRVISQLPRWKPGKQNGKLVNVMFTMPINFVIDADKSTMEIVTPDTDTAIRIRGMNDKNPLFILDGKEIKEEELKKLDTKNIQTITVLRDEASTKVYGAKGKDGVIILSTKAEGTETKK